MPRAVRMTEGTDQSPLTWRQSRILGWLQMECLLLILPLERGLETLVYLGNWVWLVQVLPIQVHE